MGKEIPGIISDGVFCKPGQLSLKHTKQFPEIFFRLGAGAKNTKNGDFFGVASKLRRSRSRKWRKMYWGKAERFIILN